MDRRRVDQSSVPTQGYLWGEVMKSSRVALILCYDERVEVEKGCLGKTDHRKESQG